MFNHATLLLAVTLALSAAAVPAPNHPAAVSTRGLSGTSIPLRKRTTFATAEGVFDKDKAIIATRATAAKHRQNLLNLEKNLDAPVAALRKGAFIKPLAQLRIPRDVQARKRQAESLTDEENDLEWAGPVSIGTPAQNFVIDFDTGSADLWVPSSACNSSSCDSHSTYNAGHSSTSAKQPGNFSILYGDGSTVSGPIFTDVVSVAGVTATGQYFSPVTTLSSQFDGDPTDGIMGLAFSTISNLQQEPFFNTAQSQGSVAANQFSFYLASKGSELYLGGTNPEKFTGDIEYHDVNTTTGFWEITGGSAKVGGTTAASDFSTIIDSGTTIMYGPPDAVKAVYAQVKNSTLYDEENGYYSFPCDSPPAIAFNWGGEDWEISAANAVLGTADGDKSRCVGSLAAQDLGLGDDVWLLGDSFMKGVYSVFDFDKSAVGFAALA